MHPNAEFAIKLKAWIDTSVDKDDVVEEAQKRGFITPKDGKLVVTSSGEKFLSKWTAGKPASTYERKPIEPTHAASSQTRNDNFRQGRSSYENQRQGRYSFDNSSRPSNRIQSFDRRTERGDRQPPRSH